MDTKAYFKSLTTELASVKDRVRNLIGGTYWLGDGQWKESVIRSVLRRYLPSSFFVGSGFVISEKGQSTQIDVLVCDGSGPLLFRDGDFIIATPDVVAGVIEVKTKVRSTEIGEIIKKLAAIANLLQRQPRVPQPFIGLFSFEDEPIDPMLLLNVLREYNGGFGDWQIQCIALGPSQFVRYWEYSPSEPRRPRRRWHAYKLSEDTAPGYFIHNVIEHIFPRSVMANNSLWYPDEGKELDKVAEIDTFGPKPV